MKKLSTELNIKYKEFNFDIKLMNEHLNNSYNIQIAPKKENIYFLEKHVDFKLAKKIIMKNLCNNENEFNEFKGVVDNMMENVGIMFCEPVHTKNVE